MKITILGGTGFLGQVLVRNAVARGHEVRALVRTPEKLRQMRDQVTVVTGNIFSAGDFERALQGSEAVISAVGPPQRDPGDPTQYKAAMESLIAAMQSRGIGRLITIGGAAHGGGENESWSVGRRMLRFFLLLFARPILLAKELEWGALKGSSLDWTLVRPPRIVANRRHGTVATSDTGLRRTEVNVEDLAEFMLDQLTEGSWIRRAPLVSSP
jgi:putative NADH-flavin reductase